MDRSVPELKDALFDTKRNSITIGVVIFVVFISATLVTHIAFGAVERAPNCDQFTWNSECDISGTLHMILGEGVIGASIGLVLALFFHRLTHRNQLKIEQIIESDQAMKNKRKDYAVGHVKNHLSLLFLP